MAQQEPTVAPARCVFCCQPVTAVERCPLLPSAHWTCCCCEAPEVAGEAVGQ